VSRLGSQQCGHNQRQCQSGPSLWRISCRSATAAIPPGRARCPLQCRPASLDRAGHVMQAEEPVMRNQEACHGRDCGDGPAAAAGPRHDGPAGCPAPIRPAWSTAHWSGRWMEEQADMKARCKTITVKDYRRCRLPCMLRSTRFAANSRRAWQRLSRHADPIRRPRRRGVAVVAGAPHVCDDFS